MKKHNEKAQWKSTIKKHNETHNETKVKLRKTNIRIKNCYNKTVTMKTGKYYY